MTLLTDGAAENAERIAAWMRLAGYVVIFYALAQRMPVIEAVAVTFAAIEVLRSVRGRAVTCS